MDFAIEKKDNLVYMRVDFLSPKYSSNAPRHNQNGSQEPPPNKILRAIDCTTARVLADYVGKTIGANASMAIHQWTHAVKLTRPTGAPTSHLIGMFCSNKTCKISYKGNSRSQFPC